MSAQPQTPPEPTPTTAPVRPWRAWLLAALPFIITAVAAVGFSLGLQALLFPRLPDPIAQIQTPTSAPTNAPAPTPLPTDPITPPERAPTTPAIPDESLLRLELLDLESENRRLWSVIYLLRAASQLDDAVAAVLINDLVETDRTLIAARRSLDRAYAVSPDAERGPIDSLRLELSQIRDDLGPRPEGVDRRLRQLRRLVLSLVDEG